MTRDDIRALIRAAIEQDRLDYMGAQLPMDPDPRDVALVDAIQGLLIQAAEDDKRAARCNREAQAAEERAQGFRVDAEEALISASTRRAAVEHLLSMWTE